MGNVTWWVTLVCTMRSRSLACSHTMKGLCTWFLKHLGRKPACAWKRAWGRPWESFPATRNFRIPQMPQQHSCSLQKKKKLLLRSVIKTSIHSYMNTWRELRTLQKPQSLMSHSLQLFVIPCICPAPLFIYLPPSKSLGAGLPSSLTKVNQTLRINFQGNFDSNWTPRKTFGSTWGRGEQSTSHHSLGEMCSHFAPFTCAHQNSQTQRLTWKKKSNLRTSHPALKTSF